MRPSFRRNRIGLSASLVLLAGLLLPSCAPTDAPGAKGIATQPAPPAPPAAGGLTTANFEAIVYRTRMPADAVTRLDARALSAQAARGEDLQKELAALGQTQILYRADQAISLTTDNRIHVGTRKPFITGSRASPTGQVIQTVQYQDVGVIFEIAAERVPTPPADRLPVRLNVELSDLADSGVTISTGVKAVSIRNMALTYRGAVPVGRPFAMTVLDGSASGQDANAVAYVCRIVIRDLRR